MWRLAISGASHLMWSNWAVGLFLPFLYRCNFHADDLVRNGSKHNSYITVSRYDHLHCDLEILLIIT
jgi:hypothetical protein